MKFAVSRIIAGFVLVTVIDIITPYGVNDWQFWTTVIIVITIVAFAEKKLTRNKW